MEPHSAAETVVPVIRLFDYGVLHLELNTLVFMMGLTLLVGFLLNRLLFRPVLATQERRRALVNEFRDRSAKNRDEIERLAEAYETRLAQAQEEMARQRGQARRSAQEQADALLERAREAGDQELQAALAELQEQMDQAKRGLGPAAERLARQVSERVLRP